MTQRAETDGRREARLFRELRHPARLAILEALRPGEACVCHLEAVLGQRQAYVSQHLMRLRDAGLVTDRRSGLNVYYRVADRRLFAVLDTARRLTGGQPAAGRRARPADCPCPKCQRAAARPRP